MWGHIVSLEWPSTVEPVISPFAIDILSEGTKAQFVTQLTHLELAYYDCYNTLRNFWFGTSIYALDVKTNHNPCLYNCCWWQTWLGTFLWMIYRDWCWLMTHARSELSLATKGEATRWSYLYRTCRLDHDLSIINWDMSTNHAVQERHLGHSWGYIPSPHFRPELIGALIG